MADLTGNKIKDTYTGLLQIEGGVIQDGTGSITNLPFNQLSGTPTLVSSSNQIASDISGSFTLVSSSFSSTITDIIDGTITVTSASYAVSSSHEITYELSSSHAETADQVSFTGVQNKPTLISSSVQIASDISGSITEFSSSISSRVSINETNITALQSFSSSLDSTFATDLELSNVSSSFATTIDGIQHTDITLLNNFTSSIQSEVNSLNTATSSFLTGINAGIVSSSKQISDFGFISSSHTDVAALNLFTSSIQSEVNSLNAATSSFLTGIGAGIISSSIQISDFGFITSSEGSSTDITALNNFSGSIQTQVDSLNAATSSFAVTTGNIFTGKQELTGSIDVSGSIEIKPTRLEVRTLLTVTPVDTKPTDLTVGTFAVSGSTPIYCDGLNWYPINLGTALPSPVPSPAVTTDSTTVTTDDTTITTDNN